MQTEEEFKMPQAVADLRDLRAPIFDTKRDQYVYKSGKTIYVNQFDRQKATNKQADESVVVLENVSDKKT